MINDPIFTNEETDEGPEEDIFKKQITHIYFTINKFKYTIMRILDNITKKLFSDAKDSI